jgi:hypothetical protein
MTIKEIIYSNLFSANHRIAMKLKYGATSAEWITIDELEKGLPMQSWI